MNGKAEAARTVPKYGEAAIERASKNLAAFYRFKDANDFGPYAAWRYMEARAAELAMAKKRISARRLIEEVRAMDFYDVDGLPTKVNNNYGAPAARVLVRAYPEWEPYIEMRPSALDEIM